MFRILAKKKMSQTSRASRRNRAQVTAEYAILIALVIAALIAMQLYLQRALQGRFRAASIYMANTTNGLGDTTLQYEPYYKNDIQSIVTNGSDTITLGANGVAGMNGSTLTNRTGTTSEIFNGTNTSW